MAVALLCCEVCFAENPVVQRNFTADQAPMVYHDTVLSTGHDDDNASGFAMYDYLRSMAELAYNADGTIPNYGERGIFL